MGELTRKDTSAARPTAQRAALTRVAAAAPAAAPRSNEGLWGVVPVRLGPAVEAVLMGDLQNVRSTIGRVLTVPSQMSES
jgi:hypothetical protein